jgi:vacuolar protein sorting-associated protein 13A/C
MQTCFAQEFLDVPLPPGWVWTSDWALSKSNHIDADGWFYGPDFQSLRTPPTSAKASKKSMFDFARRRRWVRTRQRVPESTYIRTRHVIGVLEPGASIPVPLSSINAKTDFCVQVRPHTDPVQYSWGRSVGNGITSSSNTRGDGDNSQGGSNLKVTKSGVPVSSFLLNELEKTEELLLCLPAPGSKNFCWLNMEADANILYTELNTAVYDWKLSVNAPLKLENRLPCKAEFIIWERPNREGNPVRKYQGVVSTGDSVFVYNVDLRRPVYLTWLAQGGWKPEKVPVFVSFPSVFANTDYSGFDD